MKGFVIDGDGHVLFGFDNEHDYLEDLKDGERIVSFDYVDLNARSPVLTKRILKIKDYKGIIHDYEVLNERQE